MPILEPCRKALRRARTCLGRDFKNFQIRLPVGEHLSPCIRQDILQDSGI